MPALMLPEPATDASDRDAAPATPAAVGQVARVHLASRSPRRRELLAQHGITHDAAHPGFEDGVLRPGAATPEQWVASLAYLKAWARSKEAQHADTRFVLGADTACLMDGRLIGTPATPDEAREMIRAFRGREHAVVTGVALIDRRHATRHLLVDRATVRMGGLTDHDVDAYVATGAWQGKAGAYNLAERIAAGWPLEFEGDPSTIMGLPMRALLAAFRRLGVRGNHG